MYLDTTVTIEPGGWRQLIFPFGYHPVRDDDLEVRIAIAINRDARLPLPADDPIEAERGVAVHRFWLTSDP